VEAVYFLSFAWRGEVDARDTKYVIPRQNNNTDRAKKAPLDLVLETETDTAMTIKSFRYTCYLDHLDILLKTKL
jgi:hypothetical protein